MNKKEIQDVYPLAPLQEGLLFHAILDPDSNAYFDQFIAKIIGPLNVEHFIQTWNRIQENNPIFRTAFAWQSGKRSLQVVAKTAELDFTYLDWTTRTPEAQEKDYQAFLQDDRQQPFNLSKPPLMRLTLIQLPDAEYRLVWSRHHLLLDGWSLSLILEEFVRYYTALHNQQPIQTLPRRPYRDYIQWLQQQNTAQADTFWKDYLRGLPQCTKIRIGSANTPTGQTDHYTELKGGLSTTETTAIDKLARTNKVTLNTTIKAAWALLLKRMTGENDVIFGDTVSGRPEVLDGVESQVGLFINTLPMRVQIEPQAKLGAWLRDVQRNETELRRYEFSALSQIQSFSDIPREEAFFESIVVFENYPVSQVLSAGIPGVRIESTQTFERTHYPITIIVAPGDKLEWILIFDSDLYPEAVSRRIEAYFKTLLQRLPQYTEASVGTIPLLPEPESTKLLHIWNSDTLTHDTELCLHQLFERQVALQPEKIAINDGLTELSYAELDQRATELAQHLASIGATIESRIGVCLHRSADLIVSLLAVLKTGAAYIPLDPAYPSDRINYMVEDAAATIILTESAVQKNVQPQAPTVVLIDTPNLFADTNPQRVFPHPSPQNLAYIIYTSGSTGKPKGTAIEHRNAVALAAWAYREFSVEEWIAVLTSTSVCFDLSIFEIFLTLGAGGKLILVENAIELPSHPARDEVTLINTVPSAIAELLRLDAIPSSVTTINLAGEPLTAALADKLYTQTAVKKVYDLYGPSEDTTYSTWMLRQPNMPATIGRPIANTKLYLLDKDLEPVVSGTIGEIYLQGSGVVRGYWQRPDLTAEKFIADPFSSAPGQRLYRTGDLARYLPNGNIEFLGRADHQIKIRGFRIELGEIQTSLEKHSALREVAVIAQQDEQQGGTIIAYLVKRDASSKLTDIELKAYLEQSLPHYMIPAGLVWMDALPRTPNGKLNRKALPSADNTSYINDTSVIKLPCNELEAQLLAIWQEVLGLETISVHASFFELGGHSLLATRVLSRVRKAISKEIPLRLIFEASTIEAQALQIAAYTSSTQTALDIPKVPREKPLLLSYSQERIWFLQRYDPSNSAYNIPLVVKLEGTFDPAHIEQSLQAIVDQHESLRTHFVLTESGPRQRIQESLTLTVEQIKLNARQPDQLTTEIQTLTASEASTPFQLEATSQPLFRAKLLRSTSSESILLLTLHHIIADGWSFDTLLKDFSQSYAAISQGQTPQLAALPIEYADYAHWHRALLDQGTLQKQTDFWKQALLTVQPINLPTDYPRPAELSFKGKSITQTFSKPLLEDLQALAQQKKTSLFNLLMPALQVLLARYSGQTDFAVGTPIAGRNHPDLESIVGVFINTIAYPCLFTGSDTFETAIEQTKRFSIDAFSHQDIPFEKVIEALDLPRDLSRTPLFQVLFVLQNTPLALKPIPGLQLTPISSESSTAKFDLSCSAQETDTGLSVSFEYNTALFNEATITQLLTHFESLLRQLSRKLKQSIHTLQPLSDNESTSILIASNGPSKPSASSAQSVHRAFEQQAQRTPNDIAVSHLGQSLTYTELNQAANRLAHHLQSLQIGRGRTVATVLEPSLDLAISLLAILKSGAAYVPIDPNYPATRLTYMLEDCQATALITNSALLEGLTTETRQQLANKAVTTICLDQAQAELKDHSVNDLNQPAHPLDLIYLIYTSGSTGQPKASAVHHQGFLNLLDWYQDAAHIDAAARALIISSLSFDLTQKNIFAPLLSGGKLFFAESPTFDPWQILKGIQQQGITHINCAPSAFYPLLDLAADNDFAELNSLKQVYLGGETITIERLAKWSSHASCQAEIINSYGPTECTDVCAFDPVAAHTQTIPLGRPIPNTEVYVLDPAQNLLPYRVIGEIYVAGTGVSSGYWNRPDLTADKFRPHPFSQRAGAHIYQTGDLGRMWPDGRIEYIGRKDFQIKIRGLRIELGEIEAALRALPEITDAVAVVQASNHEHPQIAAYLESKKAASELPPAVIREHLQKTLPEYMIPAQFAVLEKLPLTPSGKIDRKQLPALNFDTAESQPNYRAPESPEEIVLSEIWSSVLNRTRISIDDNFFALGGDSILSIQIVSRVNQTGYQLAPRDLFKNQTIAALAQVCQKSQTATAEQGLLTGPCPLSPIQHWFFQQNFQYPNHWNQSMLLNLERPLQIDQLQQALEQLVQQHDTTRLRFTQSIEHTWTAEYTETAGNFFANHDLSDIRDSELAKAVEAICQNEQASLDITNGPLFRISYINTGAARADRLLLIMHHLIVDGVSWQLWLEDLLNIYTDRSTNQAQERPQKTTSYRQWVKPQCNSQPQGELAFWQQHLATASPQIPRDFSQAENRVADSHSISIDLSAPLTSSLLEKVPQAYSTRIHEVLLTALARSLKIWTRQNQPLIQLESHGRTALTPDIDISRTIGWFTAIHPLALNTGASTDPGQQLLHIKESLRKIPQSSATFGVHRYLNADSSIRDTFQKFPHPEFAFNYLGQVDRSQQQDVLGITPAAESPGSPYHPEEKRPYLIEANGGISQGQLKFDFAYSQKIHQRETIQKLADSFIHELTLLINHCTQNQQSQTYSPSDFSASKLKSKDLKKILSKLKR